MTSMGKPNLLCADCAAAYYSAAAEAHARDGQRCPRCDGQLQFVPPAPAEAERRAA